MGETTLTLSDLTDGEVVAVLGGISCYQMKALAAGNFPKVEEAGSALMTLSEDNPEAVREAFLENRDAFRVAQMPDEILDTLNLTVKDGQLYRPDEDDGWTEVEVE